VAELSRTTDAGVGADPVDAVDAADPADPIDPAEPTETGDTRVIHARAVRVRLAPSSQGPEDPVIRVEPAEGPLRMTNPSIGVGPLGGVAMAPAEPDDAGVSAQRHLLLDDEPTAASVRVMGDGRALLQEPTGPTRAVLGPETVQGGVRTREVLVDGFRFVVEVESERLSALRERATRGRGAIGKTGPLQVKAIIPGKVVAVSVAAGDEVTAGQQLLVVEAMKMQNELRAPRDGTVERVGVSVGVNVEIGDLLVVIS
jgi:biotin carboxyl carrier protein